MTRSASKLDPESPGGAAPSSVDPVKGPTARVGHLLRRAYHLARENSARAFADVHLTPRQAAAVWQLYERGPLSQGELGAAIGMEAPNVHGLILRLIKKDIVARARDPRDPRRNVVSLTPQGLQLAMSLPERARGAEEQTLEALSQVERARLVALLERILKPGRTFPSGAA